MKISRALGSNSLFLKDSVMVEDIEYLLIAKVVKINCGARLMTTNGRWTTHDLRPCRSFDLRELER